MARGGGSSGTAFQPDVWPHHLQQLVLLSVKQVALQVGRDAGRRRTVGGGGQGAGEAGGFLPLLCSTLHLSALDQRQPPITTLQPVTDCHGAACSSDCPSFLAFTLLPHNVLQPSTGTLQPMVDRMKSVTDTIMFATCKVCGRGESVG